MTNSLSRRRRLALPLVICFLGLLSAQPAAARSEFGDIVVSADQPPPTAGGHGYVEYAVTITNRSATETHRVTLTIPKDQFPSRGQQLRTLSRTVEVGPSSTMRVSLWQPDLAMGGGQGLEVAIDGKPRGGEPLRAISNRGWQGRGGFSRPPAFSGRGSVFSYATANSHVFLSRNAPDAIRTRAGATVPTATSYGGSPFQFVRADGPMNSWSTNWLGYSSYAGVVATAKELEEAPPEVLSALWQYVECGGALTIAGPFKVPESWEAGKKFGLLDTYFPVFGQCLVHREPDLEKWNAGDWNAIAGTWVKSDQPWLQTKSVGQANTMFPVVDDFRVPVRGLFLLLVVFALAIGPGNFYVLAKLKRRIWMLWTIPVISLSTCLLVFGYMFISEGWGRHSRTAGLTVLDETTRRATTIGWTAFYCPITPGDGLHFGYGTELTPQLMVNTPMNQEGTPRDLDWSQDQHLARGWVTARVPAHFQLRKSEIRRERLTVNRASSGALSIVNGLGADIRELYLADKEGKVFHAATIPAGGKAELATAQGVAAKQQSDRFREWYGSDWILLLQNLEKFQKSGLSRGTYVATLDGSPFIEAGLRDAQARPSTTVVYGIMKEPGHED